MRWKTVIYKDGDLRDRQFFAWIPVSVYHDDKTVETRWLETVRVREQCVTSWNESWWITQKFLEVVKPSHAKPLPKA